MEREKCQKCIFYSREKVDSKYLSGGNRYGNDKQNHKLQNIEKMVKEQQRVDEKDAYIMQDNDDLRYLEGRYEQLNLPHTVKRVIDDYIACMQTRDERYSDLSYAAGVRDTIDLLKGMGMLISCS